MNWKRAIQTYLSEIPGITKITFNESLVVQEYGFDGYIDFEKEGIPISIPVLFKSNLVPSVMAQMGKIRRKNEDPIILSNYISPEARKLLQAKTISYIDSAGNVFLNFPGIFVLIETNQSGKLDRKVQDRAFNKTGCKVTYQFLVLPELLNATYREIESYTGVSLDSIRWVFKDLLKEGLIVKKNKKEYVFQDRETLLKKWLWGFSGNLIPSLGSENYRWASSIPDFHNLNLPSHTYWGGAAGEELLNGSLITDEWLIYTDNDFSDIAKSLRLIQDDNGPVTLRTTFWSGKCNYDVLPPLLIYADLSSTANPRYQEAATNLYNKYVRDIIS